MMLLYKMEKAKFSFGRTIRTFGRTHGKKLSARQLYLTDVVLPTLAPKPNDVNGAILEIGFGSGEHLIELALSHPDKIIIGAEPFINGVAGLMSKISDDKNKIRDEYKNIRIFPDDIRIFLAKFAGQFSLIYILHPDPWPKARHEKRRLLSAEFLKTLTTFIMPDGAIIIGTDHTDYYNWILEQVARTNLTIKSRDLETIKTRYQEKNMFGSDKTMYLVLSYTL